MCSAQKEAAERNTARVMEHTLGIYLWRVKDAFKIITNPNLIFLFLKGNLPFAVDTACGRRKLLQTKLNTSSEEVYSVASCY